MPASIVFPNPTSSARMAPLEKGDLNANNAASTWWGFISTWALATVVENFSPESDEYLSDSLVARYLLRYCIEEVAGVGGMKVIVKL